MAVKTITLGELQRGDVPFPPHVEGGRDFSGKQLEGAREVKVGNGGVVDLRGIIKAGSVVGWSGRDLVVFNPGGDSILIKDAAGLLGTKAVNVLLETAKGEDKMYAFTLLDGAVVLRESFQVDWLDKAERLLEARDILVAYRPYEAPANDGGETRYVDVSSIALEVILKSAEQIIDRRYVRDLDVLGTTEHLAGEVLQGLGWSGSVGVGGASAGAGGANAPLGSDLAFILNPNFLANSGVVSAASAVPPTNVVTPAISVNTGIVGTPATSVNTGSVVTPTIAVNTAPTVNAGSGPGVVHTTYYNTASTSLALFQSVSISDMENDSIKALKLMLSGFVSNLEKIVIGGVAYAWGSVFAGVTDGQGNGYSYDGANTVSIVLAPNMTAAAAATVIGAVRYRHDGVAASGTASRSISIEVEDARGAKSNALSVQVAFPIKPVVTVENLEISRVDASGNVVSGLEWQAGDRVRIRWFDKPSGNYVGDLNPPTLEVKRVKIDLTPFGLGVLEDAVQSAGVWSKTITLTTPIVASGDVLQQIKVQAIATLTGQAAPEYLSDLVDVRRIVLASGNGYVEGTQRDDILVVTADSFSYANTFNGGQGHDVLDYRAVLVDGFTIDVPAAIIKGPLVGNFEHMFSYIEEVWVSSKAKIGITPASGDTISWVIAGADTQARVDLAGDGVVDLVVVYKNQLINDGFLQAALVV